MPHPIILAYRSTKSGFFKIWIILFLTFKISVQNCITISQCTTVVCYTVLIVMYHSTLLYWCWWTSTVFSLESVTDLLTEPVLEVLSDLKSEEFMKSSMKLFYQFLPQDIWSSSQVIWLLSDSIWFFNWLIFTSEMLCLLANSMSKLFNFTWKYIMNTATKIATKGTIIFIVIDMVFFCNLRICVGAVSNLLLSLEVIRKVDEWVCLPRQLGSPGPGQDLWK